MNKRNILSILLFLFSSCAVLSVTAQQNRVTDTGGIIRIEAAPVEPGRLFHVRKQYSTAAMSSVDGASLYHTPAPNLTNTLYGRLPGLTVTQGTGEPGNDNALLGVRGTGTYSYGVNGYSTYKVFVDGFETNLNYFSYLSPAEIESVSILKDAAALATFGMRGANGIIWVVTKRGRAGRSTVTFRTRTGLQSPVRIDKPLSAYEYAGLSNQASSNDHGGIWTPRYSAAQLLAYKSGTGTNVDWYDRVLRKHSPYTDGDLIFSGGDSTARYNVVLDYANQQGLFNTPNTDTTSNEMLKRYNLRTNLDFSMFRIFEARVDLGGRIEDRKQPNYPISQLFNNIAAYPANIYPAYDSAGRWSGTTLYPNNPVASTRALGWQSTHTRILQGNFGLKERLDFITPGLYLNEVFSFNSYTQSSYNKTATYARYLNGATTTTDKTTPIVASNQAPAYQEDWKQAAITLGYEHQWGNHHIQSAINYHQSDYRGESQYGFSYHYQNISGRINYNYNNRWIGEFGFSYFGTDSYAPGHRRAFYPAISGAWIVSNESFLQRSTVISLLKIRASVGRTGSTDSYATGSSLPGLNGRYLYQQYYQAAMAGGGTFYTGNSGQTQLPVLSPLFIANPNISAEQSIKYNAGADLTLFNKLTLGLDVYMDKRSHIITIDNSIPGDYGMNFSFANIGKMTSRGGEVAVTWNDKTGKVGYSLSAMAAYNNSRVDYMAEVPPAYLYNGYTGKPYGTQIGLMATGFYQLNDFNADGSLKAGIPVPAFGAVQPGDLRYRDLNGDGKVDQTDVTNIGRSAFPRLTYAFGGNMDVMGLDLSVFFQGAAGAQVNLLTAAAIQAQPFVNNGNAYALAKGAWAYYPLEGIDTRATATFPRLTTMSNTNNYRNSSFWMKSGDFLRLRNIELGYTLPVASRLRLDKLRIYINAVNLVTWSSLLKDYDIDPESPAGYPVLRSFNAGIALSF
jgi:TonB-linked SusC/RagA family outer membrane protein